MSDSKLDKTEAASALAGLVAGLGAVLGVTSVNVHAAEPPATGTAMQQTPAPATARQDKELPVSAIARQDKVAPAPITGRGIPNATAVQGKAPIATGLQGKIAPPVSAVAIQDKGEARLVRPRAVPNAPAGTTATPMPAVPKTPVDAPKDP